jgi:hypothetical protein
MTNGFGLNGRPWIASTASKNRLNLKMSTGKAYKQAIKRVFGENTTMSVWRFTGEETTMLFT